jgi:hypothetical protein
MLQDMLTRIENAHQDFVETIKRCGDISRDDAIKVKAFYLKKRLAKIDTGIGRISVKHGAYLEADVIRRAVVMAS